MFALSTSALSLLLPLVAWANPPELVSLKTGGISIDHNSQAPQISKDGNYIAFESYAAGIVPEKATLGFAVYRRNLKDDTTVLVSKNAGGAVANDSASSPRISDDGSVVAFVSKADNLIPGLSNVNHLFAKDMTTGAIDCVSRASSGLVVAIYNGVDSFAMSANGRFFAFLSGDANVTPDDTTNFFNLFVYDRKLGTVELISKSMFGGAGNGACSRVAISRDGRYVAFSSYASDLVANDVNGQTLDVFVRDRKLGTTKLLSRDVSGEQQGLPIQLAGMSSNGKYIVMTTQATLDPKLEGHDLFVAKRTNGKVSAVGLRKNGEAASHQAERAQISNDGRFLVFNSIESNFSKQNDCEWDYDVYFHDAKTRKSTLLSRAVAGDPVNGKSRQAVLSANGRYAAFESEASNLVPTDTDVFRDVFRVQVR